MVGGGDAAMDEGTYLTIQDDASLSPFSGVFPAGVPVGRVDTAYAAAGRNDYVIHLDPAAPISEVGYVYVLLTRPDPEQAILEAAARDSLGIERATSALDAQLEAATEE